jgi:hypothetical protein
VEAIVASQLVGYQIMKILRTVLGISVFHVLGDAGCFFKLKALRRHIE